MEKLYALLREVFILYCASRLLVLGEYQDPHCGGKQVIVQLFEWNWEDIARECEEYLAPLGYCGVQVSPASEHIVITSPPRPWWERYQPVSYKLTSRGGDEQKFINMVDRCKRVGVRIYVDVILNHMTAINQRGYGIAGSYFNSDLLDFPGVPYSSSHFTARNRCPSLDGGITDYNDAANVRNCRLLGLLDLDQSQTYVQDTLAAFLNHLVDIGVAGFRVDAAKHMWPADLRAIQEKVFDLPDGGRPLFYHEVTDQGGEAITVSEYVDLGYVTEFRYGIRLKAALVDFRRLRSCYEPSIGMADPDHALVFVDNHDTQRSGGSVLTHKTPREYKMALVFMMAYNYGLVQMISSYFFDSADQGPPHDGNYTTLKVTTLANGSCGNGWVCEHRWRAVASMATFRTVVSGTPLLHWQASESSVGFARGRVGFFAMFRTGDVSQWFMTGLPAGVYCDVISDCQTVVRVGANGRGRIGVKNADEPYVAIHVGAQRPSASQDQCFEESTRRPLPTISAAWQRTIVLIQRTTNFGQNIFFRGGINPAKEDDCSTDADVSLCAIPIRHTLKGPSSFYASYLTWSRGDNFLDWYGPEKTQSVDAVGSPGMWTTNDANNGGYYARNNFGPDYWVLDVYMNCARTLNGWFEFKALIGSEWEPDIHQAKCGGLPTQAPFQSNNHIARCGYMNIFQWGSGGCTISVQEG